MIVVSLRALSEMRSVFDHPCQKDFEAARISDFKAVKNRLLPRAARLTLCSPSAQPLLRLKQQQLSSKDGNGNR
jgi:hypothetical protein